MKLKEYLDINDISPLEFAPLVGVKFVAVYNWLRGETIPRRLIARKIEEVTGGQVTAREMRKKDENV